MKRKNFNVIFAFLVLMSILLLSDKSVEVMKRMLQPTKSSDKVVIVIDAGHGGKDPGKVGVNGSLEKDINLAIALVLRDLMEQEGYEVIMTRDTDMGLYQETDSNKKNADMRNRVKLIEDVKPDLAVSIHQNSFTQEGSHGAQVFFYEGSTIGKKLASIMQQTIKDYMADGNHRMEKANTAYYMLKKSSCALIIIECGFLSNYKEANLLSMQDYQTKMAEAIRNGILKYMSLEEG
jgi:N-acetylmuramoyl-L-alanine amidase